MIGGLLNISRFRKGDVLKARDVDAVRAAAAVGLGPGGAHGIADGTGVRYRHVPVRSGKATDRFPAQITGHMFDPNFPVEWGRYLYSWQEVVAVVNQSDPDEVVYIDGPRSSGPLLDAFKCAAWNGAEATLPDRVIGNMPVDEGNILEGVVIFPRPIATGVRVEITEHYAGKRRGYFFALAQGLVPSCPLRPSSGTQAAGAAFVPPSSPSGIADFIGGVFGWQ